MSVYRFTRTDEGGATSTAVVRGVPNRPGYIEVSTDFALGLLADAGRDGVVAESLPGCVMFTAADLTDLLAHVGWTPAQPHDAALTPPTAAPSPDREPEPTPSEES